MWTYDHAKSISVRVAQHMCMMWYRLGGLVGHPRAVFSPSDKTYKYIMASEVRDTFHEGCMIQ